LLTVEKRRLDEFVGLVFAIVSALDIIMIAPSGVPITSILG
jgi:hypothetical protein